MPPDAPANDLRRIAPPPGWNVIPGETEAAPEASLLDKAKAAFSDPVNQRSYGAGAGGMLFGAFGTPAAAIPGAGLGAAVVTGLQQIFGPETTTDDQLIDQAASFVTGAQEEILGQGTGKLIGNILAPSARFPRLVRWGVERGQRVAKGLKLPVPVKEFMPGKLPRVLGWISDNFMSGRYIGHQQRTKLPEVMLSLRQDLLGEIDALGAPGTMEAGKRLGRALGEADVPASVFSRPVSADLPETMVPLPAFAKRLTALAKRESAPTILEGVRSARDLPALQEWIHRLPKKDADVLWKAVTDDMVVWDAAAGSRLADHARALEEGLDGAWDLLKEIPELQHLAKKSPEKVLKRAITQSNFKEVDALKRVLLEGGQDEVWDQTRFQFVRELLDEAMVHREDQLLFSPQKFSDLWKVNKTQIRRLIEDEPGLLRNLEDFAEGTRMAAKELGEIREDYMTSRIRLGFSGVMTGGLASLGGVVTGEALGLVMPEFAPMMLALGMTRPASGLRNYLTRTAIPRGLGAVPDLAHRGVQHVAARALEDSGSRGAVGDLLARELQAGRRLGTARRKKLTPPGGRPIDLGVF